MELHPIFDKTTSPNPGLWYVVSALGECPSQRVGHTATYMPGPGGHGGHVYVIGGANPSGPFSDTYVLNLDTLSWDILDAPGLKPRYEHAAFVCAATYPRHVYVFGGADQGGNHGDVQRLDTETETRAWSCCPLVTDSGGSGGAPPSPRTYHVTACSVGDRFVVYSGGQGGAEPVGDRQVHVLDAAEGAWRVLPVRGDPPKPRHGHLVAGGGDTVLVHGGMSGTTFYGDLHLLDLQAGTWRAVKQRKEHPCARAAHGGVISGSTLYMFGGMNRNGALADFYKLDTVSLIWTQIALEGPPPACRLDFAMCTVRVRVPADTPQTAEETASRVNAREVLDSQLRLASAGSAHSLGSVGSAGSQRSVGSAGSTRPDPGPLPEVAGSTESFIVSGTQLAPHIQDIPLEGASTETAAVVPPPVEDDTTEYKTVELCVVFGGMDTEGEIFDDCLVYLIS